MNALRFTWAAVGVAACFLVCTSAAVGQEKKPNVYTGTLKSVRILNDGDRDFIKIGQKVGEVFLTVTDKTKILVVPAKPGGEPTPGTVKDLELGHRVRAETFPSSLDMLNTILVYPKKEKPPEK